MNILDELTADKIAVDMEYHSQQILDLCKQLECCGCRGKDIKCPFFHVNCEKLTGLIKEYLNELDKRRHE